jgi:hypothetical protein
LTSLVNAKLVIGFESMALFLTYLVRKPLISYIPITKTRDMPLPEECCVQDVAKFIGIDFGATGRSVDGLLFDDKCDLSSMLALIEKKEAVK